LQQPAPLTSGRPVNNAIGAVYMCKYCTSTKAETYTCTTSALMYKQATVIIQSDGCFKKKIL